MTESDKDTKLGLNIWKVIRDIFLSLVNGINERERKRERAQIKMRDIIGPKQKEKGDKETS